MPAESPSLLESKSVKLYLQGYAMSRQESADALRERIAADLGRACGAPVAVALVSPDAPELGFGSLGGEVIDELPVALDRYEDPDPGLLAADPEHPAAETLVCHLFRALCPVTGQPDHASIQIRYRGPRLERAALLRYLVAYRRHRAFHEACVERIFIDLWRRCEPR
ncbi:MAG: hypothetical protein NZ555_17735, partial [Geminicoccaceae bacterium]|nr:hypothetical protein [Geminicoccaceae bacterium]